MTVSSGTNLDVTKADAALKKTYAKTLKDNIPETDKLAKMMPFVEEAQKPGGGYNQPVTLTREMGATFNSDGSVFRLNKPRTRKMLNATINGNEFVLRAQMSYAILNRAMAGGGPEGGEAGARSFITATKDSIKAMAKGASFFREATLLYGGGTAAGSALATVVNTTGSASTTLVIKVAVGDWATSLWAGSEDGEYDIFASAGTKRNSAGTDAAGDSVYLLTTVDAANTTLTFTSNATNVSNVVAADMVFFAGARTKETLGLIGACLTQTGSLWGIPVANTLWKPQVTPVGGSLTFERIMGANGKVADIGYTGTYKYLVSTQAWQDLANDQAAIVRHVDKAGGGGVEFGFEKVTFYGQTGRVDIEPYIYMKRGMALGLPEGSLKRVGSTDTTFKLDGYGKMIRELEDYAGVEMRLYWDQAPFCEEPAYLQLLTGITNTADAAS